MATLAAVNAATPITHIQGGEKFDISITGTFVGTITLERSKDGENFISVESFTEPKQRTAEAGTAWGYRLRMTAFTSGSASADIYR